MNIVKHLRRRAVTWAAAGAAAVAAASALSLTAASGRARDQRLGQAVHVRAGALVAGIQSCLPHAHGWSPSSPGRRTT